jgi:hypothetical protein
MAQLFRHLGQCGFLWTIKRGAVRRTVDTYNVGADGLRISDTFFNQFKMVDQCDTVGFPPNNTVRVTVNVNGEVTADVDNSWITFE